MPRRPHPGGLEQFNIRLPKDLKLALDEAVDEYLRAHPGRMYTRSDLIRDVLYGYLATRKKRPATRAP